MLARTRGDLGDTEGLRILQGCCSRRREGSSAPLQANFSEIQPQSLYTCQGHNTLSLSTGSCPAGLRGCSIRCIQLMVLTLGTSWADVHRQAE